MTALNMLDISNVNPVQNESQFASVPMPSAHLVVINEDEMKNIKDDNGFDKSTRLNLHCEILHSSCGNEYVGQKLNLSVALSGDEVPVRIGMKTLSTLAHTLGLGTVINDSSMFHNQPFIVIVDKDKNGYTQFKKILRTDGMEIANASGGFRELDTKDQQYVVELHNLLSSMNGGGNQQAPAQQAQQPAFAQQAPAQAQAPNFAPQAQANSFVPTNGQAPAFAQQQVQQQPQQPAFGQQPAQPQWGATVNQSNGQ